MPLLLSAFLGSQVNHHDKVKRSSLPMDAGVGYHVFVDQQLAVSGGHRSTELTENFLAGFVVPIVKNRMQEVDPGT